MSRVTRRTTYTPPVRRFFPVMLLIISAALLLVGLFGAFDGGQRPVNASQVIATHAPKPIKASPVATPTGPKPITIAAVGDSISEEHTTKIARMWTLDLATGPVVVNTNDGWTLGGSNLLEMGAGIQRCNSDYLVVMGGINDIAETTGPPTVWPSRMVQMTTELKVIIARCGIPADHVVISAVAPDGHELYGVNLWNATEAHDAGFYGWHFIDPWGPLRAQPLGAYLPSMTVDGIHPNDAGSAIVARNIAAAIQSF